jgi:hypothetical protein
LVKNVLVAPDEPARQVDGSGSTGRPQENALCTAGMGESVSELVSPANRAIMLVRRGNRSPDRA